LGIGDWGLGTIPNHQSPFPSTIPNPQSPYRELIEYVLISKLKIILKNKGKS